jgi:hypothetical protein
MRAAQLAANSIVLKHHGSPPFSAPTMIGGLFLIGGMYVTPQFAWAR